MENEAPFEISRKRGLRRLLWRRVLPAVAILAGGVTGLGVLLPQLEFAQFFSVHFPVTHLAAFPAVVGVGILFLSVLIAMSYRILRLTKLSLVSCAVWTVVGAGLLFAPYGLPRQVDSREFSSAQYRELTVVTFNSGSTLTAGDFQRLLTSWDPDIIVLPETAGYELQQVLQNATFDGQLFETRRDGLPSSYTGGIAPTSVLVNSRLGAAHYTVGPVSSFGTVSIEFADQHLPLVVGVHTAPPLPGLMQQWREDIARITEFGKGSERPLILAGDFNATLRHGALADRAQLIDSQEFCATIPSGTWPAGAPQFLQTPIDHVFVTRGMKAHSCQVQQLGSSDHLAYMTRVTIPAH